MNIKAIGKYVIIKRIAKESSGLLIISDNNSSTGHGVVLSSGSTDIEVGNEVVFSLYAAKSLNNILNFDENYFYVKIDDVVGVINK